MLSVLQSGLSIPGQIRPCLPSQLAVSKDLVSYWGFDADCMDFTNASAFDLSGNGNTGTLVASPTLAPGKVGNALSLNGTTQYVAVDSSLNSINSAGNYSICAWVYLNTVVGNQEIYAQASTISGTPLLLLDATGATFRMFVRDSAGITISALGPTITTGVWYFLVGMKIGFTMSLFQNGALAASAVNGSLTTFALNTAAIGVRNSTSFSNFLNGSVDDLRLYNRSLESGEIIELYQAGLAGRRDAGDKLPMQRTPMVL